MLSFSDSNVNVAASKVCKHLLSSWKRDAGWAATGASWKEQAGDHIAAICEAVHRQLLPIALSSIPMFASGKEQAGMYRLNCIFPRVAYLGEKPVTHHTNTVPFLRYRHTHRYTIC